MPKYKGASFSAVTKFSCVCVCVCGLFSVPQSCQLTKQENSLSCFLLRYLHCALSLFAYNGENLKHKSDAHNFPSYSTSPSKARQKAMKASRRNATYLILKKLLQVANDSKQTHHTHYSHNKAINHYIMIRLELFFHAFFTAHIGNMCSVFCV